MSSSKAAFVFVASCLTAFGSTIVVPNFNTTNVGNSTDTADGTGDFRIQELLGSGQFASVGGPILIDQFSYRAAPGTGPLPFTITSFNVFLSTSSKFPNTSGPLMSTTFADNVGPDNTLVYSGSFTANSPGCTGPAVCPFDVSVTFTTPFLYNPSQGRLLLDLEITGFSGGTGKFDSVSFVGPPNGTGGSIATLDGGLNDATGHVDFSGDIIQLRYTAVPEPASGALMLISAAALAVMGRRRSISVLRQ